EFRRVLFRSRHNCPNSDSHMHTPPDPVISEWFHHEHFLKNLPYLASCELTSLTLTGHLTLLQFDLKGPSFSLNSLNDKVIAYYYSVFNMNKMFNSANEAS